MSELDDKIEGEQHKRYRDGRREALAVILRHFPHVCCPKCGKADQLWVTSCEWEQRLRPLYDNLRCADDTLEELCKFDLHCVCGTRLHVDVQREARVG